MPSDKLCYLVTKSGIYKQVRNGFYNARIKVEGVAFLNDTKESVEILLPKLPSQILYSAEAFFMAAYQKYQSEAVVLLFADEKTGQWRMEVPVQSVPRGNSLHVSYNPASVAAPEGYRPFGTIHSHAGIAAFHSGTDDADEHSSDGLHITIGNLDKPCRSYAARWIFCGRAFPVQLGDVVEGPALPTIDPAWLEKITVQEPAFSRATDEFWNRGGELFPPAPSDDSDIPPDLQAEYDDFMIEMHQKFMDRHEQCWPESQR